MARENKKYRKHQTQKGNPMWRDPAHTGPGLPCLPVLLLIVGAPVGLVVAVVSTVA